MSMQRLHRDPDDDEPVSSRSAESTESRQKTADIGGGGGGGGLAPTTPADPSHLFITPSTTMTTADACSLSTTKSNCSSPGSDLPNSTHLQQHQARTSSKAQPPAADRRHHRHDADTVHPPAGHPGMGYVKDEPLNIRNAEASAPGPVVVVVPKMVSDNTSNASSLPSNTNSKTALEGVPGTPEGANSHQLPPAPPSDQSQNHKSGSPTDLDSLSLYSLHMMRDFRYYFQHPYFRLAIAYLVTFLNFLIYAEDPVSHSEAECFIPVVGNCFSFVCTKYPPDGWAGVKVLMWLTAIITGLFVGKLIIHGFIFNRLFKLKMFFDDKGSWMTMFFTVIFHLFIFSHLYNAVLLLGGDYTLPYRIDAQMGMRNSIFMKIAACGTWCGDFFTAWMVTDVMLQEKLYPQWAKWPRSWWNNGRVILFWIMVMTTTMVFIMVISTDWIKWDRLNRDFLPTNEMSRAFLASFILVFDLLIVMQDWDFPHFIYSLDIKLPGVNTAHIRIHIPKCLRKEVWALHITGKWFNYGVIFLVMILDLNMWKNQMFYEPFEYGQYIGPNHRIHTVHDQEVLRTHNITMLSYEWRSTNWNDETNATYIESDMVMNTQYFGSKLSSKGMAFIPSLLAFVCFGIFLWYFGRWKPTETDHYAGRLLMRKKRMSLGQRIQQSFARRRRARENQNGSSKVNLVRMKVQGESSPKVVFDNSEPDYEPLTTVVEDTNHQANTKSDNIRAPLATPEKV